VTVQTPLYRLYVARSFAKFAVACEPTARSSVAVAVAGVAAGATAARWDCVPKGSVDCDEWLCSVQWCPHT
jgi:hypothetical protein